MPKHPRLSADQGLPVTALQVHNGRIYPGVIVALFVVSSLLVTTRVVSRWRSRSRVAVDEYLIIAAAILGLIDMALIIATVSPILMSHPQFLSFDTIGKTAPLTMVAEISTSWSVALVKTSIALLLVRLQQTRGWAHFLYTVIGVQALTAIFVTTMHTTRCIPTEAIWNPTIGINDKWCWSAEAFKVTMAVASGLVIATDLLFSLIPLTFLHHIRRSVPHRIVIAILMSLGLVASAASAVKTVMVYQFDQHGDPSGNGIAIALWASIEAQVGIIAACIPCLRAVFLRFLSRIGLYSEFPSRADRDGSTWSGRERPDGDFASPGRARFHASADRGVPGGPPTLNDSVANQSEEEEETVHSGSLRGQVRCKSEIDIELSSLKGK